MNKRKHNRNFRKAIAGAVLAAACLGVAGHVNAAQYNWTGGGGSLNTGWNAPANWLAGSVPVGSTSTFVYFQNNGPGNFQNIANPLTLNTIEFGPGISTTASGNAIAFA